MVFGFVGLIFAYISEFFYMGLYKRPEILNSSLCRFYVSNFRWVIFIFALGNYIFLSPLNENQRVNWSLINLIVFFVICLIPYQSFKINPYGESEGEHKYDTYKANYIYFSTDYEKLNPFTRKDGYTKYFKKIINDEIIEPSEGERIIFNLQNKNEINSYLRTKRHLEYYIASQELNNLYMKNKNDAKIQYMFGSSGENKENLVIGGIKNLFMESSELNEEEITSKKLDEIKNMKDTLLSFSTTNTGICNALIFLGEKNNINDEFDNYHFNPWKAEWIYTQKYKKKRKEMIHKIRTSMDYRGEISDDEDSIVKFDDKRDFINEKIKQMNDLYLKRRESVRHKTEEKDETDKPMINNTELTTGEVSNSNLRLSTNTQNTNNSPQQNIISESNQRLSIKDIFEKKKNNNLKEESNINTSENKILSEPKLFNQDNILNISNNNQKK